MLASLSGRNGLRPLAAPILVLTLVLAACEDPATLAPDAPAPWEVPPQRAAELENVITGRNFEFEIDGKSLPVISTEPGAFRMELKDATMGNRKGNFKTFTVTKPHFDTWRVEKYYDQGDLTLKNLFQAFTTGAREMNPSDAGSLVYLDREDNEARTIDFFGFVPVDYTNELVRDGRRVEALEFDVQRVRYGTSATGASPELGDVECRLFQHRKRKKKLEEETDKVVAGTSRLGPVEHPEGPGEEVSPEPYPDANVNNVSMFRLDLIEGGEDPASNWYSISGGHQILHRTDKGSGDDDSSSFVCYVEGRQPKAVVQEDKVVLSGPMVAGGTRAEMLDLLNAWTDGSQRRTESTLELRDDQGRLVRLIRYHAVIPTYYAPPSVRADEDDSLLEERFEFEPVRVTSHADDEEEDDDEGKNEGGATRKGGG